MDKCTLWEIEDIIEYIPYTDRNLWEASRINSYITAQTQSTKKLKVTDILKFEWDKGITEESITTISNEDIERLRNKAKEWQIE